MVSSLGGVWGRSGAEDLKRGYRMINVNCETLAEGSELGTFSKRTDVWYLLPRSLSRVSTRED